MSPGEFPKHEPIAEASLSQISPDTSHGTLSSLPTSSQVYRHRRNPDIDPWHDLNAPPNIQLNRPVEQAFPGDLLVSKHFLRVIT
jgi:hypothetical protein